MKIILYISLALPSIGWQVPWDVLYTHPVSYLVVCCRLHIWSDAGIEHSIGLGVHLSFTWCTNKWAGAPNGLCMVFIWIIENLDVNIDEWRHGIVCFAFRDDWFAYWLNIELNSLRSHWLQWLSLISPLSQQIPRLCMVSIWLMEKLDVNVDKWRQGIVYFAFRDDLFAYWLNIELSSLRSH